MRNPDFGNLLRVLHRERPARPTLFEFFLNGPLYRQLAGPAWTEGPSERDRYRGLIAAFRAAGYDYVTVRGSPLHFAWGERRHEKTISLNEGALITDRRGFERYAWPDPDAFDYSVLDDIAQDLPRGMKAVVCGPGGVLENVIALTGYDNLCFMLADDPALATDIFEAVGSRLVRHYRLSAGRRGVGACISNDDWGFKTQPMLSPDAMRQYVFPWHRRIVETIHAAGVPAILHSCGELESLMEEIVTDLRYDGKHSFEDVICPVEEAYRRWGGRIAILGGIDLDFVCRSKPERIRRRSLDMLKLAADKGGYALGTGNSVPEYVQPENYFAMTSAALDPG